MSEVPVTHAFRGVALVACALLVVWLSGCAATPMPINSDRFTQES